MVYSVVVIQTGLLHPLPLSTIHIHIMLGLIVTMRRAYSVEERYVVLRCKEMELLGMVRRYWLGTGQVKAKLCLFKSLYQKTQTTNHLLIP